MNNKQKNTFDLKLISKGNQLEFARLISVYSSDMFHFAKGFTSQKELAEEIVSDVFIKLWEKRKDLPFINNLKSYLFIAVKNSSLTALRKNKNNEISLDDLPEFHLDKILVPESEQIESELMDIINEAIDRLPPKCKLVFSMAKIQGFKRKEIAGILDISEKTVEYHLSTAVKKLVDLIDNEKGGKSNEISRVLSVLFAIS